jgi:hypothetical protein
MASTFFRSVRSLDADNSQRSYLGLALAASLLAAWILWFFLARVSVYAVTNKADLEVDLTSGKLQVVANFDPPAALGRIRPGQHARLRLAGFPWAQYGSVSATITNVASEIRDGSIRVEMALDPNSSSRIPLQHGLPGSVEVQIETVSPANFVLRTVGGLLAGPKSNFTNLSAVTTR